MYIKLDICTLDPVHGCYYSVARSYFHVATEREVLSEGVTFEPIVSENSSEIRMVREEHTIHVPHLHTMTS